MNKDLIFRPLFENDDTPMMLLYSALVKIYDGEFINWEPETIWLALQQDMGVDVSDFIKNKIQAATIIVGSERYYQDWKIFECSGKAINDSYTTFEYLTPLSSEECCWTIIEANLIDNDDSRYDYEVSDYIRVSLNADGVAMLPDYIATIAHIDNIVTKESNTEQEKRIRLYCKKRIDKIIALVIEYFNKDITKDIKYIYSLLS